MFSRGILFALWATVAHRVEASCSITGGSVPSWCNWESPRVNVIQNVLYMDGGSLYNQYNFSEGCYQYQALWENDNNPHTFSLNLSTPFNSSTNFSAIVTDMSLGLTGSNLNQVYIDGTMFATDYDFWLYGGMPYIGTEGTQAPDNQVIEYEAYNQLDASNWSPGPQSKGVSDNVTTYITNGAGASAPSEYLGFYFGGAHTSGWGPVNWQIDTPNITSNKLITVNMSYSAGATWENDTLPSYIQTRESAELVWVPVSDNGVLVAIGGVLNNSEIAFSNSKTLDSTAVAEGEEVNPTFMERVSVYDVGSKTWYLQNTTGDTPPALANFCAVLASASDGSSHNIYIYGGFDGISGSTPVPQDDVYILSLPSFKWVKAYNGTTSHGRMSHRCVKIYPDQMLSVGGYRVDPEHCVEGGVITTFNLNNLTFQDAYDPAQWSDYKVPDILTEEIGGDSSGGATATGPSVWTNSSLADVFGTKYTKTINHYYPYNTTSSDSSSSHHGGGLPTWAKAVIGVLVGLFGVALIVLALWFCLRRRQRRIIDKEPGPSEADGTERLTTMYGGGPVSPVAGPQSVSTGQETSAGMRTTHTASASISTSNQGTVESGGGPLHEMHDSSPVELPTAFNNTSSTNTSNNQSSEFSAARSPSPISPQTPDTESARSLAVTGVATAHRTMSTRSIDNVVATRSSHFRETFDTSTPFHKHQGSEVSEASQISSSDRAQVGETIHENE